MQLTLPAHQVLGEVRPALLEDVGTGDLTAALVPAYERATVRGSCTNKTALTATREAEISKRLLKHWHVAVPDDRMAHLVKDTARSFLRSLQARLGAEGVSLGHCCFLRILWDQDGLTQRELSQEAGLVPSTTMAALRGMEELGYITRERRPENRKNIYIFLVSRGKALRES